MQVFRKFSFSHQESTQFYYIEHNTISEEDTKKVREKLQEQTKAGDLILVPRGEQFNIDALKDRFIEKWEESIYTDNKRASLRKKDFLVCLQELDKKLQKEEEVPRKKIVVFYPYHLLEENKLLGEGLTKIKEILKDFKFQEITK